MTLVEEKHATPPLVTLAGNVNAPHTGVVLAPDSNGNRAVTVPARMAHALAVE